MGPTIIFDKSTLHGLSADESVWVDAFYQTNIPPVFFAETLADLEKKVLRGRDPEEIVGDLAAKTPVYSSRPNLFHRDLALSELIGKPVEMAGVPVIGGGRIIRSEKSFGFLFKSAPEMDAMNRWQRREFLDVERGFAKAWRRASAGLLFGDAPVVSRARPVTLAEAKALADGIVSGGNRYRLLQFVLDRLELGERLRSIIVQRWKNVGGPSLRAFAPFTAHLVILDSFFHIGSDVGLISRERASHKIDLAYLYYLPFCQIFSSNDKLHRNIAPLFLTPDQVFIDGSTLKEDCRRLDEHYSRLPEEVLRQGVMRFAQHPPTEGDFLTSRLWDRFMSERWRENAQAAPRPITKEVEEALRSLTKKFSEGAEIPEKIPSRADADFMTIESRVPIRRGKWRMFPPEVAGA